MYKLFIFKFKQGVKPKLIVSENLESAHDLACEYCSESVHQSQQKLAKSGDLIDSITVQSEVTVLISGE